MTFTEAAAHVLRLVGKPLHYKEITDVAIERDLLSHVGKSPEVTMGARLAAVVKKDPKDNPLVRVKPGVFALRDWDQSVIDSGLADRTPALERLAKLQVTHGEDAGAPSDVPDAAALSSLSPDIEDAEAGSAYAESFEADDEEDIGEDERERAELAAAATELFVPEEDDDEPILGGDAEVEADSSERSEAPGKRRRRRRRRGGRSGLDEDSGLPSYTVSDAPLLADAEEEGPASVRGGEARRPEPRADSADRRGDGRGQEARGERGGEGRSFEARAPEARAAAEVGRGVEDLSVPAVLALLEQLLPPRSRSGSIPTRQLAEQGIRRVRAKVELQQLQDAIADAVRHETVRARIERRRPRFVLHGRAVSSTEWGLDPEVVRLEKELASVAGRYRDAFQRSFGERLQTLQPRALGDFFVLLLSQLGFENIEPVRRQGAHNQELHFSAIARSATGDVPTAIIARRDGRDIGRERVIDLRGALHHYNGALAGLLATTGQVMSGAREEARVPNAAPVNLLDGPALAKLSAQHGVGVAFSELRLPMLDSELFDSLTAG